MIKTGRFSIIMLVCFLAVIGCGDDSTQVQIEDGIVGHVSDNAGNPVAGAAIGLVYETHAPDPYAKPTLSFGFVLPEAGYLTVMILDGQGETFRMLMDEDSPAGNYSISWNTLDANGDLAPNGIYNIVVEMDREEIARASLLLSNQGDQTLFERANAITDTEGNFTIPKDLVPTGIILPVWVEGEVIDQVVSNELTIEVAWISGQETSYSQRSITLPEPWENFSVEIQLP